MDAVNEVEVGGFGGAGAEDAEIMLKVPLPAVIGGEVGGEPIPPLSGAPGAVRTLGCSTSAYRHTGHVPLVFSHVIMQSSWNA